MSSTSTAITIPNLPTSAATHALTNTILEDFFFGPVFPGCELPCWQGLVIDESSSEDVFFAFDRAFEFQGLSYLTAEPSTSSPGYIYLSHTWEQLIQGEVQRVFVAGALINPNTNRLELLRFGVPQYSFDAALAPYPDLRISQILQNMGEPFYWQMKIRSGGQGSHIAFASFMVYRHGVSFYHYAEFPTQRVADTTGSTMLSAEFCLNDEVRVTADIARPLANGFETLSDLEERIYAIRNNLLPGGMELNVNQEELVNKAVTESQPCIMLEIQE